MINNQTNPKKARRNDIILISAVLLAALLGIFIFLLCRQEGAYAVVTRNGEEIGRYSLAEDREIVFEDGAHKNIMVIENGKVSMKDANCPDRLCVGMRAAFYRGQTVVCLPHGIVITVVSEDDTLDVIV